MQGLDKFKLIDEDSIASLFKLFRCSFQNIDNLLKNDIEMSSFYLHGKMETMRDAMEEFETKNELVKK